MSCLFRGLKGLFPKSATPNRCTHPVIPLDDSFQFRKSSDTSQNDDAEFYILIDGKQQGPFTPTGLCMLIRAGKFPRSAHYRIDGVSNWAPISGLDDEVETRLPRPHHYAFAYRVLPSVIFGPPSIIKSFTQRSSLQKLTDSWRAVGESMHPGNTVPPNGLEIEVLPYSKRSELLLITLPVPRRPLEAYFVAIVVPRANLFGVRRGVARYFLLSHSAIFGENEPEGTVRELLADGSNIRCKDFVDALKPTFIAAVHEICPE